MTAKTHLISVAISNYANQGNLPNAINDSETLQKSLTEKYKVETFTVLHNEEATRANLENTLRECKEKINEEDSLIFVFNGHGDEENDSFYFLLHGENTDDKYFGAEFINKLRSIDCKHIILLMNSCFSGNIIFDTSTQKNLQDKSRMFLTAGSFGQQVDDSSNKNPKNSPFINAVVNGLQKNTEVKLSLASIYVEVQKHFENTEQKPQYGHFEGYGYENFYFELIEDEKITWEKAQKENNIVVYETYLARFPKGDFSEDAQSKLDFLVSEQKYWLLYNQEIANITGKYVSELKEPRWLQEIKDLNQKANEIVNRLTEKTRMEEAWTKIKYSNMIGEFRTFIGDFSDSEYIAIANRKISKLEKQLKDRATWNDIPNKNTPPRNRKPRFELYCYEFPNGEFVDIAKIKIKDLSDWINIENENDDNKKVESIKRYLNGYDQPEYKRKAEQLLEKLTINKNIQKLEIDFQEAQQSQDIAKLNDLKNDIEGFSPTEKSFAEKLLQKIIFCISEYENGFKNEALNAIKSDRTDLMIEFYQKYQDTYFQEFELFKELKNCLNSKEESTYRLAEKSKQIADYEAYINDFQAYENAVYLSDAKKRIEELREFEKVKNSKEVADFALFLETFPNTFLKDEVQKRIEELQTEKAQNQRFEEIQKNPTIELCKEFLKNFGIDSEKGQKIYQILDKLEFEQVKKAQNSIEACERYIDTYPDGQFLGDVKTILKKLISKQKELSLFEQAKSNNDIESWQKYLYETEKEARSAEDEAFAKERLKELQAIKEDHEAFEKADTKESYLEYMTTHKNGLHFEEAEKAYNKKYSGFTDANEFLGSKIDSLPNAIQDSMKNVSEELKKGQTETNKLLETLVNEIKNKNENKGQFKLSDIGKVVIFILIMLFIFLLGRYS
ncbi:MAG: hypothetical protein EAZ97_05110 [Bacteroidetes bacterium]|nr:MAG: hypothetical protein EAZ97_05110 [Bacteroidota bacterium]